MDNLKYYNHSLAYDYSLFTDKKSSAREDHIVKISDTKVKNKKATKKAAHKISARLGTFAMAFMVVALICSNIFLRAQVTEVKSQINEVKSQINLLQGEETRLSVEYENIISYQNLEKAAVGLGMKKMDKSQVVYIRVNDFDVAKTGDGELIDADN